jgi:hypothetical protein
LCGGATAVVRDGDGEGITAVGVGIGCVGPGSAGFIDRCRALGRCCADCEVGVIS